MQSWIANSQLHIIHGVILLQMVDDCNCAMHDFEE